MRLHTLGNEDLSWIEFQDLVMGLLAADTRLNRHFQKKDEEVDPDE